MRSVGSGLAETALDVALERDRRARVVVGSAVSVTLALRAMDGRQCTAAWVGALARGGLAAGEGMERRGDDPLAPAEVETVAGGQGMEHDAADHQRPVA